MRQQVAARSGVAERDVRAPAAIRVCFVLNSWTYGGVEAHVALLGACLRDLGYDPLVVCSELSALRPLYERLDTLGIRRLPFPVQSGSLGKSRSIVELAKLFRAEHVDVAHLQLIFTDGGRLPLLAAKLARVPVVVTHHAAPRGRESRVARFARWPIQALTDQFVAVSNANRTDQIRYMGLPPARLTTVHNGITVSQPLPDRIAAHEWLTSELGLPSDVKLVGAIGRLAEQKGLHTLIDATPGVLGQQPNAHVVLVGDGPTRESLEAQTKRLGVERAVHFLGFRSDTPRILAGLDVLAMPSVFEGLPLALIEAFAAGCPVVAHDVDGIPEVIDDGLDGFLVPAGDVRILTERIVRLLRDSELAALMSRHAREKALTYFTAERMARDTAAIYDRVLGARRRRE